MMLYGVTSNDVKTEVYPTSKHKDYLEYLRSVTTSTSSDIDPTETLDFSSLVKRNFLKKPYDCKSVLPLFHFDWSSKYPMFEYRSETSLVDGFYKKIVPDQTLEYDVFVHINPIKKYTVRVKVKKVKTAIPHIIEPTGV